MKAFIIKSIIFLIIVLSITTIISLRYKPYINMNNDFMAAIIDKHERLKEAGGDNRLILVGGSNLAFGINSEEIQKELNLNVVNLGIHAGLGIPFMLNEVIPEVQKGDVIVLCFEYPIYDSKFKDIKTIEQMQLTYPKSKSYYKLNLLDNAIIVFNNFRKTFESHIIDTVSFYNRKSFNKYGDVIAHIEAKKQKKLTKDKITKIESITSIDKFHELNNKCKSVGAKLLLTFPCYAKSEFEFSKSYIKELELMIRKDLHFIPVIGSPETFVFDDSDFYDTVYHLNGIGRETRTKILINILKKALVDNSLEKN